MGLIERAQQVGRALRRWPGIRHALEADYARTFSHCPSHAFRGVYGSFAEAEASIPPGSRVGYDNAAMAAMYRSRMQKACESDYPILFWLRRILQAQPDCFVFDLGGHIGISYHGWRDYLDYSAGMRWLVCDLPAVVEVGRTLAAERQASGLAFTSQRADGSGCDVLLAAGSLQYIDEPLPVILAGLGHLPRHLLVSKLPLYEGEPFVTVQATGRAFHAYRIMNRGQFVAGLAELGYRAVDDWTTRETSCRIPFVEGRDIEAYSGYYFRLERSGTQALSAASG